MSADCKKSEEVVIADKKSSEVSVEEKISEVSLDEKPCEIASKELGNKFKYHIIDLQFIISHYVYLKCLYS